MADVDAGLIIKALIGAGLIKGVKGYAQSRAVNAYGDTVNANLPQGYQVNVPRKTFRFGDLSKYQGAIDNAAKSNRDQYTSDYLSKEYGIAPGPLGAVEKVFSSVNAPLALEREKYKDSLSHGGLQLEQLPQILKYLEDLQSNPQSFPPPVSQPRDIGGGVLFEPDPMMNQGVLQASASQYGQGDLPSNIDPKFLERVLQFYNTNKGQEVTKRGQDLTRQTAEERLNETTRRNNKQFQYWDDQIGLGRGRLNVSQGNLGLGRERLNFDKRKYSEGNTGPNSNNALGDVKNKMGVLQKALDLYRVRDDNGKKVDPQPGDPSYQRFSEIKQYMGRLVDEFQNGPGPGVSSGIPSFKAYKNSMGSKK